MKKITFELSIEDASTIAMWIPEIIEKGVDKKSYSAFIRLGKALENPIKK